MLVVTQLAHHDSSVHAAGGGTWMGLATPPTYLDGGVGVTSQLLATRLEVLKEQVSEEEQQMASREKLEAQRAYTAGEIKAVSMLRELLRDDGCAASTHKLASERAGELEQLVNQCAAQLAKYEKQRAELEEVDQGFEQAYGALGHFDAMLATLHSEQAALLDAIRLQAHAKRKHAEPSYHAVNEHRRWLRELGGFETAAGELRERAKRTRDIEVQEVVIGLCVDGLELETRTRLETLMASDEMAAALRADLCVWGGVLAHEDDLAVTPSTAPMQISSTDGPAEGKAPPNARDRRSKDGRGTPRTTLGARGGFSVMLTVSVATRELLLKLHAPTALESLNTHLHRTRDRLSGGSIMLERLCAKPAAVLTMGKLHIAKALSASAMVKKAMGGHRQLLKQLEQRIGYDFAGHELVSAGGLKALSSRACNWEWCAGALRTMHARQMIQLDANQLPAAAATALSTHPYDGRARYEQLHEVYEAHLVAGTGDDPEREAAVQAAALEHWRELDRQIYLRYGQRHNEGSGTAVVASVPEPAAADDDDELGLELFSALATRSSMRTLEPLTPAKPNPSKWKRMMYATQGAKSSGDVGGGGSSTRARKQEEALVVEAMLVSARSREINTASEEIKSYRRVLKRSCALEGARARLLSHMATLATPILKPNKAVEAADKRRLLGEDEFPYMVHDTVEAELKSARAAANAQLSVHTIKRGEAYHMATLTMRAASGAVWVSAGGSAQHNPRDSKRRPPMPAGRRPADAEMVNELELPGRRRLRASLHALIASASAHALVAERAALDAHFIEQHKNVDGAAAPSAASEGAPSMALAGAELHRTVASPGLVPAHASRPARTTQMSAASKILRACDSVLLPKAGTYKTADEACANLRLFPRTKLDSAALAKEAAGINQGRVAFLEAVQAHADGRCNLAAKEAKAKSVHAQMGSHALRRPQPPAHGHEHEVSAGVNSIAFFGLLERTAVLWPRAPQPVLPEALVERLPHLLASPSDTTVDEALTAKRVERFADKLGVIFNQQAIIDAAGPGAINPRTGKVLAGTQDTVVSGSSRCHVLPLVVMAMSAPLPPGWTCHRSAEHDDDEFEHVESGVRQADHPLLPTLRRWVQGELKRQAGKAYSTLTCHEWIRVAEPVDVPNKDGGSSVELRPVWVNMVSGTKSREFPMLGRVQRDALFRRGNGWSDKQRGVQAFYELTTLRQNIGDLPPSHTLRARSQGARARALARKPLTMLEVLYAGEAMGMDVIENPQLAFLAEEALCLELPLGWERIELAGMEAAGFYRNGLLRLSQWQHPKITYLMALGKMYTAADAVGTSSTAEHGEE